MHFPVFSEPVKLNFVEEKEAKKFIHRFKNKRKAAGSNIYELKEDPVSLKRVPEKPRRYKVCILQSFIDTKTTGRRRSSYMNMHLMGGSNPGNNQWGGVL